MIVERDGNSPVIAADARVAATASIVGNVVIGPDCVVGHGAVLESSGPPIVLDAGVVVMPMALIRSVGGKHRPAFAVRVGAESLIGPFAALAGCTLGAAVYVATQVMVFHGAEIGDGTRLGAGSIVHTGANLPPRSRVGLRQVAVPSQEGVLITSDHELARAELAKADFFGRAFDLSEEDPITLHRRSVAILRAEAADWDDLRAPS